MQKQMDPVHMRVLVQMIDPSRIKSTGPPDDPMDLVPFRQQEVRQVRAILARDPSNKCFFHSNIRRPPPAASKRWAQEKIRQAERLTFRVPRSAAGVQRSRNLSTFNLYV